MGGFVPVSFPRLAATCDPGFDVRTGRRRREGRSAEVGELAEDPVEPMVGGIADLGALVRGLEQAGAHRGRGKRLDDLDRGAREAVRRASRPAARR